MPATVTLRSLQFYGTFALPLEPFQFEPESVVLLAFTGKKVSRQRRLGRYSFRGEQIDVTTLIRTVAKVLNLDETLAEQRAKAVVRLPKTHAQLA